MTSSKLTKEQTEKLAYYANYVRQQVVKHYLFWLMPMKVARVMANSSRSLVRYGLTMQDLRDYLEDHNTIRTFTLHNGSVTVALPGKADLKLTQDEIVEKIIDFEGTLTMEKLALSEKRRKFRRGEIS